MDRRVAKLSFALLLVFAAAQAAQAQSPQFRFVKDLVPGEAAPVIGAADVDGDGDQDLFTNGSGVFLNDGNGRFSAHPVFSDIRADVANWVAIAKPILATGDLNGDGAVDALAGENGAIRKWVNAGNGMFSQLFVGLPAPAGMFPRAVALGDVDGDGDLDAVVAYYNQAGYTASGVPLQLWLNDGAATFTSVSGHLPSQPMMPAQLALRDLDGDGDADLLAGGSNPQYPGSPAPVPATVYLNDGAGFFPQTGLPLPVAATLDSFAFGHVNADGLPDIALDTAPIEFFCPLADNAQNTPLAVPVVLLNVGGGSFSALPSTIAAPFPGAVPHLLDVDGDGLDDLVRFSYLGTSVHPLGGGALAPAPRAAPFAAPHLELPLSPWMASGMAPTVQADFDGDGDQDLVVFTAQGNEVVFNGSAGQLVPMPDSLSSQAMSLYPRPLPALADFEGDGDVDLFLSVTGCVPSAPPAVRVAINDGRGNLVQGPSIPIAGPSPMDTVLTTRTFFDADQDGDADCFFANPTSLGYVHYHVLTNNGTSFTANPSLVVLNAQQPVAIILRSADVDGDGDLDVIDGLRDALPSHVLLNNGSGVFQIGSLLPPATTWDFEIADLDGDGDPDIVQANGFAVAVLLNDGTGTFTPAPVMPQAGGISVEIADFDLDGDNDLLLNAAVYLNAGNATFAFAFSAGAPSFIDPYTLSAFDVDSDGDTDVLDSAVRIVRNIGGAAFGPPEPPLPVALPYPVLHADFDQDGDEDLVVQGAGKGPAIFVNVTRQLSRGWPARPGRIASLEMTGAPGAAWALFASAGTRYLPVPPLGTVFVDLNTAVLVATGAFSPAGTAVVSAIAPTGPGVVGLTLYWQAAMVEPQGLRISGLEVTTITAF